MRTEAAAAKRQEARATGKRATPAAAPARRPTMIDVANEARVSQTTVSLVLNHADGARLSAETRERVIKAAAKLGYQPGRRGGAPAVSRRDRDRLRLRRDSRPTRGPRSASTACAKRRGSAGSPSRSMATRGDADMEAAALAQLASQPLLGLDLRDHQHPPRRSAGLRRPRCRLVLLNCHAASGALPSVVPGEVAGGHAATDFLIRAGHRRIGYINGEASMEASRHRLQGYRQALATADLPFDPDLVRDGNWQPLSGYEATRALMRAALAADRDLLRQRSDGGRLLRGAARTGPENPRRRRGDGLRRSRNRRSICIRR